MQVVDHEIKRYDALSEEVEKKKKKGAYNVMAFDLSLFIL